MEIRKIEAIVARGQANAESADGDGPWSRGSLGFGGWKEHCMGIELDEKLAESAVGCTKRV
jgi:hypothetical protein